MKLETGKIIRLSLNKADAESGTAEKIYVDYANMRKVLDVGGTVFVDDGLIALAVTAIGEFEKEVVSC